MMRLLEFPCGRPARRQNDPSPAPAPAPTTTTPTTASADESPTRGGGERRRRASHNGETAWRPSLVAITEDRSFVAAAAACSVKSPSTKEAKAAKEGRGPGKAKAKPAGVRAARPAVGDDHRYYGVPTLLPAFAPTPFLF